MYTGIFTSGCGSLAQSAEQLTFNQRVAGSSPARPTTWAPSTSGKVTTLSRWRHGFESRRGHHRVRCREAPHPLSRHGRLAQRKSVRFTREGSGVQIPHRPPLINANGSWAFVPAFDILVTHPCLPLKSETGHQPAARPKCLMPEGLTPSALPSVEHAQP